MTRSTESRGTGRRVQQDTGIGIACYTLPGGNWSWSWNCLGALGYAEEEGKEVREARSKLVLQCLAGKS